MSLLQTIKKWLYDIITRSGIILYVLPVIKFIMFKFLISKTDKIADRSGNTMYVTKWNGRTLPAFKKSTLSGVKNFNVRQDDVLLLGYPKTGCHWTYEILSMLVTGKFELSKYGKGISGMLDVIHPIILDSFPSPRILNSHLLYEELPTQIKAARTKMVLTVRNPKDTVVSYFNHVMNLKMIYEYEGSFDDFFELFLNGENDYGSYFDYHLKWGEVMKSQNDDNPILVVEFERLKTNTLDVVKEIAGFLNIVISDEVAQKIVDASTFNKMKKHNPENKLFRKGKVGDWHNWLSDEQSAQMDRLWQEKMTNCFYQPNYNQ